MTRPNVERQRRGLGRLEFVVVVILISVLIGVFARVLLPLRGQIEATRVARSIAAMQVALGNQLVLEAINGRLEKIAGLEGSNPVALVQTPPGDWRGELAGLDPATLQPGDWAFDSDRGVLVYRVHHEQYFSGDLMHPPRGEWRIVVLYAGEPHPRNIRGVLLAPLANTAWRADES